MGTIYETVCGCLSSRPEPSPADRASPEWQEWAQEWARRADAHHAYCCQQRQRDGVIPHCLVGQDDTCPHLA